MMNVAFVLIDPEYPSNAVMYLLEIDSEIFDYISDNGLESVSSVREHAGIDPYDGVEISENRRVEIDGWIALTM